MSKYFIDPKVLPGKGIAPGSEIRVAYGAKIMLSFVSIQPGAGLQHHLRQGLRVTGGSGR